VSILGSCNGSQLLRLHSCQPIAQPVHRSDEQSADQSPTAQGRNCSRIRVAIPHPSAGPLRGLHRHQSGNPAGKGNQRLEAGQKNSAYRENKPYVGGLGGANFCFAIAGVKAGEAKERSKTRNEAKRGTKQNEQQVPRRPESGLARDDNVKNKAKELSKTNSRSLVGRKTASLGTTS